MSLRQVNGTRGVTVLTIVNKSEPPTPPCTGAIYCALFPVLSLLLQKW
jgi:hypothetical protein